MKPSTILGDMSGTILLDPFQILTIKYMQLGKPSIDNQFFGTKEKRGLGDVFHISNNQNSIFKPAKPSSQNTFVSPFARKKNRNHKKGTQEKRGLRKKRGLGKKGNPQKREPRKNFLDFKCTLEVYLARNTLKIQLQFCLHFLGKGRIFSRQNHVLGTPLTFCIPEEGRGLVVPPWIH